MLEMGGGEVTVVDIREGKTGMFYADCPSPGMTQTHRGETLYDLAVNVQLSHGLDIEWEMVTTVNWPTRFNFEADWSELGARAAVRFWEEGCHPMGLFHYWRSTL